VVLSGVAATTVSAHRAEHDTGCNVRLKGLKMLSDPQRKIVDLQPKNTTKARDRKAMIAVRTKFEARCGKRAKQWQPLGAVVLISGVGFFDIPHTQNPHAPNFAELHPVRGTDDRLRLLMRFLGLTPHDRLRRVSADGSLTVARSASADAASATSVSGGSRSSMNRWSHRSAARS
jgi:hypothetical protein